MKSFFRYFQSGSGPHREIKDYDAPQVFDLMELDPVDYGASLPGKHFEYSDVLFYHMGPFLATKLDPEMWQYLVGVKATLMQQCASQQSLTRRTMRGYVTDVWDRVHKTFKQRYPKLGPVFDAFNNKGRHLYLTADGEVTPSYMLRTDAENTLWQGAFGKKLADRKMVRPSTLVAKETVWGKAKKEPLGPRMSGRMASSSSSEETGDSDGSAQSDRGQASEADADVGARSSVPSKGGVCDQAPPVGAGGGDTCRGSTPGVSRVSDALMKTKTTLADSRVPAVQPADGQAKEDGVPTKLVETDEQREGCDDHKETDPLVRTVGDWDMVLDEMDVKVPAPTVGRRKPQTLEQWNKDFLEFGEIPSYKPRGTSMHDSHVSEDSLASWDLFKTKPTKKSTIPPRRRYLEGDHRVSGVSEPLLYDGPYRPPSPTGEMDPPTYSQVTQHARPRCATQNINDGW